MPRSFKKPNNWGEFLVRYPV